MGTTHQIVDVSHVLRSSIVTEVVVIKDVSLRDVGLNLIVLPDKEEKEIMVSFLVSVNAYF